MYALLVSLFITTYVLQSAVANPISQSSEDLMGHHGEPYVNSAVQQRAKRYYGYHSWFYPGFSSWGYYPGYHRRIYYHYPFYAWGK
ncbi:Mitochondrial carrier protein [Trichuris trichiura]|uniref:Mitochondrial carrier protein n=1 Tax=Trichuris trichiura TaxID=36087 RepID=A0A077ZHS2_TRITR|nr:Mitochondrial carrier protein [Trichuris trichiura]